MPRRKIVIASMMHETNTFSPVPTPLESFRPLSDEAAIAEFKDTNTFTHAGIDPRRKRYVVIESRQHFRAGFEAIARHIVLCDGDGVTSSDLTLFDYRKRRRPLYPFEPL